MLDIDTHVAEARNQGQYTALICTDQSAAFDLVKSPIIATKLKIFGMVEL